MDFWSSFFTTNFMQNTDMFRCFSFQNMSMPIFDFNGAWYGYSSNGSTSTSTSGDTFVRSSSATSSSGKITDAGGKTKYDNLILKYAEKYGVEADFIRAIIKAESDFNPNAKSRCGAQGLMQLMPATARSYGVQNPYDPEQNIEGGVKMLAKLLEKFNGNKQLVAAGYNAGPNRACLKEGKIPNIPETQAYVKKVTRFYNEYRAMG